VAPLVDGLGLEPMTTAAHVVVDAAFARKEADAYRRWSPGLL
jgi:hypothetical protein